uniref:Uncharacterized protein n=1 Tax=Helianthus annuus TaxID=4232 RepID=A0A251UQN4_HELAN
MLQNQKLFGPFEILGLGRRHGFAGPRAGPGFHSIPFSLHGIRAKGYLAHECFLGDHFRPPPVRYYLPAPKTRSRSTQTTHHFCPLKTIISRLWKPLANS